MSDPDPRASQRYRPEQLLGRLNAVEKKNAPEWLYVAGEKSLLGPAAGARVSIVGTRSASLEGLKRASRLARELSAEGVIVVSGLARGIDTAAHLAAIEKGRTIAVLGNPLDQTYPRENAALQRRLTREHVVVSQFAPGSRIRRTNFPQRNRTMALVTHATVIVEAAEKSGTLSQGWEALRLGRRLFILRSVAEDPSLTWPSDLRRYGAEVLKNTEQLLDALPLGLGAVAVAF